MDMQQTGQEGEKQQTGRWSKQEHQRFMYAIMQYGKDWKKVEQYVRTRSGSQVRSHAQKFFNKLQKINQHPEQPQRGHPEFSETQLEMERQFNNDVSTPLELVSLIKRQSKEEGGTVNLQVLKSKLEERHEEVSKEKMSQHLPKHNSYKSMSNILSAYEEVNAENKQKKEEDEGFLILLTKKYKNLFGKLNDFENMVEIHNSPGFMQGERKRSFTLPEGNDLSGQELDEKLEEIKKLINTDQEKKTKTLIIKGDDKKERKAESKGEEKLENKIDEEEDLPGFNRLATIQEQVREEEQFNSYKLVPRFDDEPKLEESPQKKNEEHEKVEPKK